MRAEPTSRQASEAEIVYAKLMNNEEFKKYAARKVLDSLDFDEIITLGDRFLTQPTA